MIAISGAANFVDLGSRSLWLDEFQSAVVAMQRGAALWPALRTDNGNMLFYYALLHVSESVLGPGPFALRALSAVAGMGTTAVVFLLGRRLFSLTVGVIAGLLTALSLPMIVWAQQARGYALGTLLISWSFLALTRAIESKKWSAWLIYGLAATLSLYTLAISVLFFVPQLAGLLFLGRGRRPLRQAVIVLTGVGVAIVPLLLLVASHGSAQLIAWAGAPGLSATRGFITEFTSANVVDFFGARLTANVVTVAMLGCWLLAVTMGIRKRRVEGQRPGELLLVVSWLLLPFTADLLFSVNLRSIFVPSLLVACVPAGTLLAGLGISYLSRPTLISLITFMLAGLMVANAVPTYGVSGEDWQGATRLILTQSSAQDCMMFNRAGLSTNFAYYWVLAGRPSSAPRPVLPSFSLQQALVPKFQPRSSPSSVAAISHSCRDVWVIVNRPSFPSQLVLYAHLHLLQESFHRSTLLLFAHVGVERLSK
ncbi:MAG: glycosyltransferase family 39 protein [Acidimicrobiales bacterium]